MGLSKFIKTFACSEKGALRTLGGEYIANVVSLDWGPAMKCPRVLSACIEGNLASSKVSDGICKLITPGRLDLLTRKTNRSKVLEAEKLMEDARSLCSRLGVADHVRVKKLGLLDSRCIYHICNKGKEAEGKDFNNIK